MLVRAYAPLVATMGRSTVSDGDSGQRRSRSWSAQTGSSETKREKPRRIALQMMSGRDLGTVEATTGTKVAELRAQIIMKLSLDQDVDVSLLLGERMLPEATDGLTVSDAGIDDSTVLSVVVRPPYLLRLLRKINDDMLQPPENHWLSALTVQDTEGIVMLLDAIRHMVPDQRNDLHLLNDIQKTVLRLLGSVQSEDLVELQVRLIGLKKQVFVQNGILTPTRFATSHPESLRRRIRQFTHDQHGIKRCSSPRAKCLAELGLAPLDFEDDEGFQFALQRFPIPPQDEPNFANGKKKRTFD